MNKTLLVLKHEIITLVSRKSFWFVTLGIPIILSAIFGGIAYLNTNAPDALSAVGEFVGVSEETALQPEGFVDPGGIIQVIPEEVEASLLPYPDEDAARQAVDAGEIAAFFVIPANFVETGELFRYTENPNPLSENPSQEESMKWLLQVNLLEGDKILASRVNYPYNLVEVVDLDPVVGVKMDEDNMAAFYIPYFVTILFYVMILGTSSLLLNSVAKEKQTRVIEVLLLSVTPRQMLTGKIIGLGITGMLQTLIFSATGYAMLWISGRSFELPPGIELPPSILAWGLVFFILGYALYASLMAGLGALVPNLKEASQATIIVIFPLIVPMFFMTIMIQDPMGTIALVLSLIPFTAPVTMLTRLAATSIPLWQPLLAIALLLVTIWFVIRSVANMFHAQTLLSGQPFKTRRFFAALLGRI